MLIAFKLKLALACAAGLAGPLAVAPLVMESGAQDLTFATQCRGRASSRPPSYRVAGDFTKMGRPPSALGEVSLRGRSRS